ncbi:MULTISPECIES: hypothetical protein [unclassified Paenibacillus]|uniref:hypothetical protein n=1 Tax=unclassified Paenibacillus TaxID=185978 RepID=UPI003630F629
MSNEKKGILIKTLFDVTASEADRDDCAIYLADFDDEETIQALFNAANDFNVSDMIRGSCGESLAEIWLRKQQIDFNLLLLLKGTALTEVLNLIKKDKLEWYERYMRGTK